MLISLEVATPYLQRCDTSTLACSVSRGFMSTFCNNIPYFYGKRAFHLTADSSYIGMGRMPVTLLGACLALMTQPCYQTPDEL